MGRILGSKDMYRGGVLDVLSSYVVFPPVQEYNELRVSGRACVFYVDVFSTALFLKGQQISHFPGYFQNGNLS